MSFRVMIFIPTWGVWGQGKTPKQSDNNTQLFGLFLFWVLSKEKASPHPCEVGQYYYSPLIQNMETEAKEWLSWRPLQESVSEMEPGDKIP